MFLEIRSGLRLILIKSQTGVVQKAIKLSYFYERNERCIYPIYLFSLIKGGNMKKQLIIFAIFCIFFIPYTNAICEYIDIEKYTEFGKALCLEGSNTFHAEDLIISDFVNGTKASFSVYNPNSFQVKVFFNYSIQGHLNKEKFYGILINGKDKQVIKDICFSEDSMGDCSIIPSSIQYFVTKPRRMDPCLTNVSRTREICNKPCENSYNCSQTICNIAGFCGKEKIVPCPEGKRNCDDIACVTPTIKLNGENYLCEWECKSGAGIEGVCIECKNNDYCQKGVCNIELGNCVEFYNGTHNCNIIGEGYRACEEIQRCVLPSSKKNGQRYSCMFECQSKYGKNGVCAIPPLTLGLIIVVFFTIFAFIGGYVLKLVRNEIWFHKVVNQAEILRQRGVTSIEERKKIEELIDKRLEAILLEEQRKKILKKSVKDEKKELKRLKKIIEEKEYGWHKLMNLISQSEIMRNKVFLHHGRRVRIKKGYYVIADSRKKLFCRVYAQKNIYYAHEEWFKQSYPDLSFNELAVHHIDSDKLNDDVDNLAIISKEEERDISHQKIPEGDRKAGIKELKRVGVKQPHIPELNDKFIANSPQ